MNGGMETWLPAVGWEGIYEVSSHGRVRSLARTTHRNGHPYPVPGRILRASLTKPGYPFVNLKHEGRHEVRHVHFLVMRAFVGPVPAGQEVAHGDGNPGNPHLSNLRYATREENLADRVIHGTDTRGIRNGQHVLTEAEVLEVVELIDEGHVLQFIADRYGVARMTISHIRHGETWGWLTGRSHTLQLDEDDAA